jgi:hypothetical protein
MKQWAGGSWRLPASAWAFDSGLALAAAGVSTLLVTELMNVAQLTLSRGMLAFGYALVLLHTLSLVARRRFPGAVLGISVASGLAVAALGVPPVVLGPAILVAVYSVAAYGDRWVSLAGLAAAELGAAAVQLTPGRVQAGTVVSNGWSLAPRGCWATTSVGAAPTPPGWSRPLSWSGPGPSRPAVRWPRNACAWRASCMTWSPTASA